MNGRTCQLCGKPLSRIWAGSGGDFCSREHRNQYRLRCGMDRLLEANKHASLMRRRDQLRQFPAAQLRCTSNLEARVFGTLRALGAKPAVRAVAAPAAWNPKIDADNGLLAPRAPGELEGRPSAVARAAEGIGLLRAHKPVAPPARASRMPVAIPRADVALIRSQGNGNQGSRRNFARLGLTPRRTFISARAFRALGTVSLKKLSAEAARILPPAAKAGNAFRVSGGAGFRAAAMRLRSAALAAPSAAGMKWPESRTLPRPAYAGRMLEPNAAGVNFSPGAAVQPATPEFRPEVVLQQTGAATLRGMQAYVNVLETRPADWMMPPLETQRAIPFAALRTVQRSGPADCRTIKLAPVAGVVEYRVEGAKFQPTDQAWINPSYSRNTAR